MSAACSDNDENGQLICPKRHSKECLSLQFFTWPISEATQINKIHLLACGCGVAPLVVDLGPGCIQLQACCRPSVRLPSHLHLIVAHSQLLRGSNQHSALFGLWRSRWHFGLHLAQWSPSSEQPSTNLHCQLARLARKIAHRFSDGAGGTKTSSTGRPGERTWPRKATASKPTNDT